MNKLMQAANQLRQIGSKGSPDTLLAHITPQEADLLRSQGGSGRIDPNTGLPHFDEGSESAGNGGGAPSENGTGYQTQYSNLAPSGGDPTYNSKGYYSAAGDYAGGSDPDANPTRYYDYRRTIGGDIANYFGADPEGGGSKLANFGVSALGFFNPYAGYAAKLAQAVVGNQSEQSPADMNGMGGSPTFAARLMGNNVLSKLANNQQSAKSSTESADSNTKSQNKSSYAGNDNRRTTTNSAAGNAINWGLV